MPEEDYRSMKSPSISDHPQSTPHVRKSDDPTAPVLESEMRVTSLKNAEAKCGQVRVHGTSPSPSSIVRAVCQIAGK